ncbi:MAG TPA: hypothetical protein VFJ14_17855 [Nocardioidaceae bacterium]|nr:hypothetical protein [Nocardioidaceae bacterium]
MKDFANHMKAVKAHADLTATPKDIELWLFRDHNLRISEETIRKALRGDIDPTTCSVDLLVGLVAYFGVSPAGLGRFAEHRIATVLALASTTPDSDGPDSPSDQVESSTKWYATPELHLVAA